VLFDPLVWAAGDGGHFLLPRGRGDRRRSAIWQHFRHAASGRSYLVIATHLSHAPERARARYRQARRIARRARLLIDAGEPVIVLGDFNSWAGRSARTPLDALGRAGFVEAIPHGTLGTRALSQRPERLDHILVSPLLGVAAAGIADPPISGHASDHRLVWADLI
jgi:endonuclease/exonuclease/phosphatase family metal-dependent hydrolase